MKFFKFCIVGFKFFVELMEFIIGNGFIGVVGLNGCGKFNFVEVLCWVMGENFYKNMCVFGMDDVIFFGSFNWLVCNMVEVMFFLENND